MGRLALPRAILVDCTASADVAASYKEALAAGASVVCANKIANSGPLPYYRELRVLAASGGLAFRYGANVGAGLPVISTLQDLVATGDRVFKIEAVLSGTLSYLFNNFVGDRSFSSLVREAMDLGFTEPDPRVDLSALDAARKTLILAREIGYAMELADVEVAPLCPPSCDGQSSIGDFLSALGAADGFFEGLKRSAAAQGNSLRYVSSVSEGKAQISLRSVDAASPFAALRSNDNLVAFWTARYAERPLILQGPGAGAEVTAAGLLADILRCARKS
jgi:aspartokinase/homoserine dehydrogenase 1